MACFVVAAVTAPVHATAPAPSGYSAGAHLRELDRRMLAAPIGGGPSWTEVPPPQPIDHGPLDRYAPVTMPVADLDGDGRQDVYTFERSDLGLHAEARSGATGVSRFSIFDPASSVDVPEVRWYALAHDLVGDGATDLVIFRVSAVSSYWYIGQLDQRLTVFDGRDGSEVWSTHVMGAFTSAGLAQTSAASDVIGDVDVWRDPHGDGLFLQRCDVTPPGVVECTGEVLRASDGATASRAPFTTPWSWYLPEIEPAGDLDGNGVLDLLHVVAAWPSQIVAADRVGTRLWSRTVHGSSAAVLANATFDHAAGEDLVVQTYDAGWRAEGIDGATGASLWSLTHGSSGSWRIAGDVDADGIHDVLRVDTTDGTTVTDVRSGADGLVMWSRVFELHMFDHDVQDLDGDGVADAALRLCAPPGRCGSEDLVGIAGVNGATIWTTPDPRERVSLLGGDANGNGTADLARWSGGGMAIVDGEDLREIRPAEATPVTWRAGDQVHVVDVLGGSDHQVLVNARGAASRAVGLYGSAGEIWRLSYVG